MIPAAIITEWEKNHPWSQSAQVEQDLVLSRALVVLFQMPALREGLVFRGGTALHKVALSPPSRYSEDLDFVQASPGPIGPILDAIRTALDPWLGIPRNDRKANSVTLQYRFASETPPVIPLRLKVEINTREHSRMYPVRECPFHVTSRWFQGEAVIPVYQTSELLGTKLRALYQRRKGRDLFDLWYAHQSGVLVPEHVIQSFHTYMAHEGHTIRQADYLENLDAKLQHPGFQNDTPPLLRPGILYNPHTAADWLKQTLLANL